MNRADFDAFWSVFRSSNRFEDLKLDADEIERLVLAEGNFHFRTIFRVLMEEYARRAGKLRWGEKTPHHRDHIGEILEWFPDARIIFMIRDPRAVCASMCSVPWRGNGRGVVGSRALRRPIRLRRIIHDAALWQEAIDRFAALAFSDPRLSIVRYEDLVTDSVETLRDMCAFIGEEYCQGMIRERGWNEVPPPTAWGFSSEHASWRRAHVESTLKPLTQESVAKWERQLSTLEINAIEACCTTGMRSHHYELHSRRGSYSWPFASMTRRFGTIMVARTQ
jgi:hypothetical protein